MAALSLLCGLTLCARSLDAGRIPYHPFPTYDEIAYLDVARDFSRHGIGGTVLSYFQGRCLEDNRRPLYMLLLAPLMRMEPQDFTRAKAASLLLGLGLCGAVFWLCRRRWGPRIALAASIAVALSPATSYFSQCLMNDVLLAVLYFSAIMTLLLGKGRRGGWLAFGLIAGLAYAAKQTGLVLLLSAAVFGLAQEGRAFLKKPGIYLCLLGFVITAGFILCRNTRVWHNPFHDSVSGQAWIDSDQERFPLIETGEWKEVGPRWYLRRHGFLRGIGRLAAGMSKTAPRLAFTMAVGPSSGALRAASGICLLLLALLGLARRHLGGHRDEAVAFLAPNVIQFVAFSWAQPGIGTPMRYFYPMAVSLFPMAALGGEWLCSRSFPPLARRLVKCALPALVLLSCLTSLRESWAGLTVNPLKQWYVSDHWRETTGWMRQHGVDREGFLTDSNSLFSLWDCGQDTRMSYPFDIPDQKLSDFVAHRRVRYALVDRNVSPLDSHRQKYGTEDAYGPATFMGWPRCFHDSLKPSTFSIYSAQCPKP